MSALTDERLRTLWGGFLPDEWRGWLGNQHRILTEFHEASREQLATVEMQRRLWSEQAMGSVGAGRSVNINQALTDEAVVGALLDLREREWPVDTERRSEAINSEYRRILGQVSPRLSKRNPRARLKRAFSILVPRHTHCVYQAFAAQNVADLVLGYRQSGLGVAVRVRARLRMLEDPEDGLLGQARMSIFCWWLHANSEAIKRGEQKFQDVPDVADHEVEEPLAVWSYSRQRKSLTTAGRYVDALRAVVQVCQGGETEEGIRVALRDEHDLELPAGRFRGLIRTVNFLELIETREGDRYYPSDLGEAVLDADPPGVADELVEGMIVRMFGVALLLRHLQTGPLPPAQLYAAMRQDHSVWQSDQPVRRVIRWVHSLDLIERDSDRRWRLNEMGQSWARRLPEQLPLLHAEHLGGLGSAFDSDEPDEPDDELVPQDVAPGWSAPSFAEIWQVFQDDPELRSFIFDRAQVQKLHLAWHLSDAGDNAARHKRFAILSGLSGTGKTALLMHYVRVYCRLLGVQRFDTHWTLVAVSPDWRDPSGFLGYFNALGPYPNFVRKPALDLVLNARADPERPYFLILDEMNLAHVERYFAPFLSAMETGTRLHLHGYTDVTTDVPPSIRWPRNLFIGGTVNMDETTHGLSDKVLDRAFVIEFWRVDLAGFCARRRESDRALINDIDEVYSWLQALNEQLYTVRRHVGYRAFGEALDYLCAAAREPDFDVAELWTHVDHAVYAKVLPRFRGHHNQALERALASAHELCVERGLTSCADKLAAMQAMLEDTGMVRFFG